MSSLVKTEMNCSFRSSAFCLSSLYAKPSFLSEDTPTLSCYVVPEDFWVLVVRFENI